MARLLHTHVLFIEDFGSWYTFCTGSKQHCENLAIIVPNSEVCPIDMTNISHKLVLHVGCCKEKTLFYGLNENLYKVHDKVKKFYTGHTRISVKACDVSDEKEIEALCEKIA